MFTTSETFHDPALHNNAPLARHHAFYTNVALWTSKAVHIRHAVLRWVVPISTMASPVVHSVSVLSTTSTQRRALKFQRRADFGLRPFIDVLVTTFAPSFGLTTIFLDQHTLLLQLCFLSDLWLRPPLSSL